MNILLTNDDGFDAPGILTLYHTLKNSGHTVLLVAPDREKSAVGHGISLNRVLRLKPVEINSVNKGYAVNGTPADCVKLGLFEFYDTPPDMIIAGINPGSNTGVNIDYSGTAAAAREAAFNNIPGIAVSLEFSENSTLDYEGMSRFIAALIIRLGDVGLDNRTFLNINGPDLPVDQVRGVKITTRSGSNISEAFEKRKDPKNRIYYWYGRVKPVQAENGSDIRALSDQFISITPILCDADSPYPQAALKQLETILSLTEASRNDLLLIK